MYTLNCVLNKFDLLFFHLGAGLLVLASLFDKPVRDNNAIKYPLGALLGFMAIHIFVHKFGNITVINMLNVVFASMIFVILYTHLRKPKSFFKYFEYAAWINIVVFIAQKCGLNIILDYGLYVGEEGGLMGNGPRLMTYLTVIFPFLSLPCQVVVFIIAVVVKELTLLALVGIMLSISLYRSKWKYKTLLLSIMTISAIAGAYLFHGSIFFSLKLRFIIWKQLLTMFFDRPLIGYGLGMFKIIAQETINIPGNPHPTVHAFSSILEFLFNVGIGALIWLGFTLRCFRKYFKINAYTYAIIAIGLLSCIEYPFEIIRLWYTLIAVIVLFIVKNQEVSHAS